MAREVPPEELVKFIRGGFQLGPYQERLIEMAAKAGRIEPPTGEYPSSWIFTWKGMRISMHAGGRDSVLLTLHSEGRAPFYHIQISGGKPVSWNPTGNPRALEHKAEDALHAETQAKKIAEHFMRRPSAGKRILQVASRLFKRA